MVSRNGWSQIPARIFDKLSEDEKREIELKENLRRKDLTPYERSKTIVTLAETAAEIDRKELSLSSRDKSKRGRPVKAGRLKELQND